jgi:hypothetical protein
MGLWTGIPPSRYYTTLRKTKFLTCSSTWMDFRVIMLNLKNAEVIWTVTGRGAQGPFECEISILWWFTG